MNGGDDDNVDEDNYIGYNEDNVDGGGGREGVKSILKSLPPTLGRTCSPL